MGITKKTEDVRNYVKRFFKLDLQKGFPLFSFMTNYVTTQNKDKSR